MQIQPSFWMKVRRLCADHLGNEAPLRSQVEDLITRIPQSAKGDQHQMMADLFSALGQLPNSIQLGFLIGEHSPATSYGALSLGILTAPTISDVLRFVAEANHLVLPLIDYNYEEAALEGRLTIGFRCAMGSSGEAMAVAFSAAAMAKTIARCSGHSAHFSRLELTPSSKRAEADYRRYLSLSPYMDCPSNSLVVARRVMALRNPHADPDTFQSVVSACEEQLNLLACRTSLLERARQTVMSEIAAPLSQEKLAKALDLSPRQLRLRLGREHTSYQEIVRDCRTEYASTLLRNPSISLSQIADRLGYSGLSAFSHTFYRWTGKSPSEFRNEMLARGA